MRPAWPPLRLKRAPPGADHDLVGAAVAVHESADRPGWPEIVIVLLICSGLLVGLGIVDDRAARREAARAAEVLDERAKRAGERASRESMTAQAAPVGARTDNLGRESSPIVIPAGPAWGPGTSVVSHTQTSEPQAAAAAPPLRRIDGPPLPAVTTEHPMFAPPVRSPIVPAAAPVPARTDAGPVLLLLMGGAGLSLAGAGLRLLSRRSA